MLCRREKSSYVHASTVSWVWRIFHSFSYFAPIVQREVITQRFKMKMMWRIIDSSRRWLIVSVPKWEVELSMYGGFLIRNSSRENRRHNIFMLVLQTIKKKLLWLYIIKYNWKNRFNSLALWFTTEAINTSINVAAELSSFDSRDRDFSRRTRRF